MPSPWWSTAVFYEVYVRSFADASGDGVGDLAGVEAHLDHLASLGVDALWLTPFFPSPQTDHGYDVADPRDVDPLFGDLAGFDALLAAAHSRGLRLIVDIVPNHVSSRHPWFAAALADGPGSAARQRFWFRDGVGPAGDQPANNWRSTFGGPAWTRVPDGQWYLHLFAPEQPDLNWEHPDVGDDFERTLRFWADRGVDGFRIDVAHALVKDPALPDNPGGRSPDLLSDEMVPNGMYDQPGVHEVWRRWRRVVDSFDRELVLVGEVWLGDPWRQAAYVRSDELHLAFNFRLLFADWDAATMRAAIERSTAALRAVGAAATWVLSNHDVVRHVTRYGSAARARAALLLVLALPGAVFLYQGEELGLPEVDLPDEALTDPVWERSGHRQRGRDGCRVPLPWSGTQPPYGFGDAESWLPQPADWGELAVAAQEADPDSMLAFYRRALAARPRDADPLAALRWRDAGPDILDVSGPRLRVVVNLGAATVDLPGEPLLTSGPLEAGLPPDTAAWLQV